SRWLQLRRADFLRAWMKRAAQPGLAADGWAASLRSCDTMSHLELSFNRRKEKECGRPPVPPGEPTGLNQERPEQGTEARLRGRGEDRERQRSDSPAREGAGGGDGVRPRLPGLPAATQEVDEAGNDAQAGGTEYEPLDTAISAG